MKKLLALPIFFMISCSPIYKTFYNYDPPKNPQAMGCISACSIAKTQCEQEEQRLQSMCLDRVSFQEAECERRKIYGPVRVKHHHHYHTEMQCIANCTCFTDSCAEPNYDACLNIYNQCYIGCGGIVTPYEQCVMFCR